MKLDTKRPLVHATILSDVRVFWQTTREREANPAFDTVTFFLGKKSPEVELYWNRLLASLLKHAALVFDFARKRDSWIYRAGIYMYTHYLDYFDTHLYA